MRIKYLFMCSMILSFIANAEDDISVSELNRNEILLKSQSLSRITYNLRDGGAFGYSEYKVTMKNGVCSAVSRFVMGKPLSNWKKTGCEGYTLEDLFKKVRIQIERKEFHSKIQFNSEYGFIENFISEPYSESSDDEWYFEITKFKGK